MIKNKKEEKIKDSKQFISSNKLLNTQEAAEYLGTKPKQLENFRSHKLGPKFIKRGRICLYNKQDLDKWQEARKSKKTKKPLLADSLKDIRNTKGSKSMQKAKKRKVKVVESDEISKDFKVQVNTVAQAAISEMKDLIDSKKGFLVNKTYVAIFKNIMLALISLVKEIEELKKKVK